MSALSYFEIFKRYFALQRRNIELAAVRSLSQSVGTLHLLHHSLLSPLNVILLESDLDLKKRNRFSKKKLDKIQKAARMINEIIESILYSEKATNFLVKESAKKVTSLLKIKAQGKDIILKTSLKSERISGSVFLFEEVLRCLISNALEAYKESAHHKLVFVKLQKKASAIELLIADFGKGMNSLEKFIAPIKGVTFKKKGNGIGLFTARSIVIGIFGGTFTIQSKPGFGTIVRCSFPLVLSESI